MPRRVLIFDTSVLCCWLSVPGKETAGSVEDRWDHARIQQLIRHETSLHSTFVLPLAGLVETGNHIAQAKGDRYALAANLVQLLRDAVDAATPWAAFTDQSSLWQTENLKTLADQWPELAKVGIGIADATIKIVAEYYAGAGYEVEILTGDAGLKAYQPTKPVRAPRRRGG